MSPKIASVEVVPVAGHDSMLLNLSGAHGPFFTRNVVIVTDSDGNTGLGEVPGGEAIAGTIRDAAELLQGKEVARFRQLLRQVGERYAARDAGGRGAQTGPHRPALPRRRRERRPLVAAASP
jgi:glucarate dehydratase